MSIFKKIELYHEKTIFWDIMGKLNRLVRNKHRRPLILTSLSGDEPFLKSNSLLFPLSNKQLYSFRASLSLKIFILFVSFMRQTVYPPSTFPLQEKTLLK